MVLGQVSSVAFVFEVLMLLFSEALFLQTNGWNSCGGGGIGMVVGIPVVVILTWWLEFL